MGAVGGEQGSDRLCPGLRLLFRDLGFRISIFSIRAWGSGVWNGKVRKWKLGVWRDKQNLGFTPGSLAVSREYSSEKKNMQRTMLRIIQGLLEGSIPSCPAKH